MNLRPLPLSRSFPGPSWGSGRSFIARGLCVAVCSVTALSLVAAPAHQSTNQISDGGNFLLKFSAHGTRFEQLVPSLRRKFKLEAVTGYSKTQGLEFSGDKVSGIMRPGVGADGKDTYLLENASLVGRAKITMNSRQDGGESATTFEGPRVDLSETKTELTVTAPNDVVITSKGHDKKVSDRTIVTHANHAVGHLEPFASKVKQRIRDAELSDGVTMDINTVQNVVDEDTKETRIIKSKARVTAAKCSVQVTSRDGKNIWTFHLTGSVHVTGDQTEGSNTFIGDMTLSQVTFTLNDNMELLSFDGGSD